MSDDHEHGNLTIQRDVFGFMRIMEIEPPDARTILVDVNVLIAMVDRANMATEYERRMAQQQEEVPAGEPEQ